MYLEGTSAVALAESFSINRETVLLHLQRRGVDRRANVRKMTDDAVRHATNMYLAGESVEIICAHFDINSTTLRRELVRAGVELRRPGRPPTP